MVLRPASAARSCSLVSWAPGSAAFIREPSPRASTTARAVVIVLADSPGTLAHTFSAVARDETRAHGLAIDACEQQARTHQVTNRERRSKRQRQRRGAVAEYDSAHALEYIGRRQCPRDHLHPWRECRQRIEDAHERRHHAWNRPDEPLG